MRPRGSKKESVGSVKRVHCAMPVLPDCIVLSILTWEPEPLGRSLLAVRRSVLGSIGKINCAQQTKNVKHQIKGRKEGHSAL